MYINEIEIENFRTFRKTRIPFVHPEQDFARLGFAKPRLANINLLLGNNGLGKTTLLKAIALASLGPAVGKSGIFAYRLVRREPGAAECKPAILRANFTPHPQDKCSASILESHSAVVAEGDLESLEWRHTESSAWQPIYSSDSDAFFMVGYGATRRAEKSNRFQPSIKSGERAQRVMGLFEEDYALRPLNTWLPQYRDSKKYRPRYRQVVELMNELLGKGHYQFHGEQDSQGEFLFERAGLKVPFSALSDGYRCYIGWVGDLLYHVCRTCPERTRLVDNKGLVMIDEIDLHLHPKWQMTVLPTLSTALPNLQFIATTHSPLVVGSLEWMNLIVMMPGSKSSSKAARLSESVHGLDADQVLLTEFFGLASTRAPGKKRLLRELSLKARKGDTEAAKQILEAMSAGMEESA